LQQIKPIGKPLLAAGDHDNAVGGRVGDGWGCWFGKGKNKMLKASQKKGASKKHADQ
jgi:hypothetical protein